MCILLIMYSGTMCILAQMCILVYINDFQSTYFYLWSKGVLPQKERQNFTSIN
uniref:Uncharacterized protein n=1 Tax=Meloidogyne enterolobii TaxID=390850 RepID=A0A6V7W5Y2_MELEN|nr:unnamed protein product [Meloidogyne enterolobii]